MSNYISTFALKQERTTVESNRQTLRAIIPGQRTNMQWRALGHLTRRLQVLDVTIYSREHNCTVPTAKSLMHFDADGIATWAE